jgi:hypothetical protein
MFLIRGEDIGYCIVDIITRSVSVRAAIALNFHRDHCRSIRKLIWMSTLCNRWSRAGSPQKPLPRAPNRNVDAKSVNLAHFGPERAPWAVCLSTNWKFQTILVGKKFLCIFGCLTRDCFARRIGHCFGINTIRTGRFEITAKTECH